MKKFLIILSLLFFTTDSFASGIDSNSNTAPCTNNTLETYSGNSNLSADWQPNEIQLRWYNNNTLLDVQTTANTCVYDGTLTVPQTAPIRTGYTFAGWQVRPEMDFATLNTDSNRTAWYGKDEHKWCAYNLDNKTTEHYCSNFPDITEFDELEERESKIVFEHGTLYLMGRCSPKNGNNNYLQFNNDKSNWAATSTELDISGEQKYCWCKATGYKPNNQSTIYGPSQKLDFIYLEEDNAVHCSWICTIHCASRAFTHWSKSELRAAFLGLY